MNQDFIPIHFFDNPIEVTFDTFPVRRKTPPCPDSFIWEGRAYMVTEKIAEWVDFSRRGRMARNMRPAHAVAASDRGSLGVGRFYFRVRTSLVKRRRTPAGIPVSRIFDIYYDREIKNADDRLGHWFLYRELSSDSKP
jgi:hypothetical protein